MSFTDSRRKRKRWEEALGGEERGKKESGEGEGRGRVADLVGIVSRSRRGVATLIAPSV